MGIQLQTSGPEINFTTKDFGIIRGYEFTYTVADSKYAKGHKDHRILTITGSISRTLTKDKENNTDIMKQIRKWAKMEYGGKGKNNSKDNNKDNDDNKSTYYHHTKITHTHKDQTIREITFPHAFIKDFKEQIDPHTGDGTYTLTLMQKADKRIDVIIDSVDKA